MVAPPPAKTNLERELEKTQRTVTQGRLADINRRRVILELHRAGMTQVEIAARLSRAARAVGGGDISEDVINKLVARARKTPRR